MSDQQHRGQVGALRAAVLVLALGLGYATAAQLPLRWEGRLQSAAVQVEPCQSEGIGVSLSEPEFNADADAGTLPWQSRKVRFHGVQAACLGERYEVAMKAEDTTWRVIGTGVVRDTSVEVELPHRAHGHPPTSFAITFVG